MAGLTRQALVVSASRFLNQGLMVISPVILARLLTVGDFGIYREFLLYVTVVGNLAAFSLANSLLYFVGLQPAGAWGYVRRVSLSVAGTSLLAVLGFYLFEQLSPKPLIGEGLWPCVLYVLFYVNLDFWEFLWVAQKKPTAVLAYTSGRLLLRIGVVLAAAATTRDVGVIVWSLVVLEGARLVVSAYFWRRLSRREPAEPLKVSWKDHLEFCVPSGIAVFVTTLNSSLGGIFIDQSLGEAALAQFVIGGYVLMIVYPLRNSVSDVILPEMAAMADRSKNGWLPLWQRSVVLFAILLFPAAALLVRYAEIFVSTVFSEKYIEAVPILQWHCVLLLISCFDIAVVLRAINRTRSMLMANVICVVVNVAAMALFVPTQGGAGAALALVLSAVVGLGYLVVMVARMQDLRVGEMLPLRSMGRVGLAAGVALLLTLPSFWTDAMGLLGAVLASAAFGAAFLALLFVLRVGEAQWLMSMIATRWRPARAGTS